MRVARLAILGAILGLLGLLSTTDTGFASPTPAQTAAAQKTLRKALTRQYAKLGRYSGAYAVDLSTGQSLYVRNPDIPRLPASVEKLYTTTTALLKFGPSATLSTSLLATGAQSPSGTFTGTLYLHGGGDPSFGSAAFDRSNYGTGATVQQLVANLVRATHMRAFKGRVIGDSTYLDGLPGTVASGYAFNTDIEGSLSALPFNRGLHSDGSQVVYPAAYAARQLVYAMRAAHISVRKGVRVSAGHTPSSAQTLAAVQSPTMATLIALTNAPSDNFFAEMLLKGLGARFGAGGSSAAGAGVVIASLRRQFGIHPKLVDGSGLSYADSTSPSQMVTALTKLRYNHPFWDSLAVGGESGTLADEMRGTRAQGNCRGKTGTLSSVANLVGYCHARNGHTLAFAFYANSVSDTAAVHSVEGNQMAVALADYSG